MSAAFPTREDLASRGYSRDSLELYDIWRSGNNDAQLLSARLTEVFGDPPRPRITLHVARGLDNEWTLSEGRRAELSALDPEQHWTDVTAEACRTFQEYFTFADAEGWRFYLPAFLRHELAEFPLGAWDAGYCACRDRTRFELFTVEQVKFAEEFLKLHSAYT